MAGTVVNTVTEACDTCRKGTFRGGMDPDDECRLCPKGWKSDQESVGSCLPCIPGEYNDEVGQLTCKQCEENSFSDLKARNISCSVCGTGRSAKIGSTVCSSCSAGKRIDTVNGKEICVVCIAGMFSPMPDLNQCYDCVAGYYQKEDGKTMW